MNVTAITTTMACTTVRFAGLHGANEQSADPGPCENSLDYHGAPDQPTGLQRDEGNESGHGVAKAVAEHDFADA